MTRTKAVCFFSMAFLLLSLSPSIPAFAYTDACEIGERALPMTSGKIDELVRDNSSWRIEGVGAGRDVKKVGSDQCQVIIKCPGADVFVYIDAGRWWGSITELGIGERVTFTGNLNGIFRRYYQASDNSYVEVWVKDASVHKK